MSKKTKHPRQYVVPAVRRAGQIMKLIAEVNRPLRLSDLTQRLNLPKSTVLRIVRTLEVDGFLSQADENGFEIGRVAYLVGSAYRAHINLESTFHGVARALVALHNETVQLAVLDGTSVVYIAKEESSQSIRLVSQVGSRLPAHVTALGKALLSRLSEDDLRRLYKDRNFPQMTHNSHRSVRSLMNDLEDTRRRGWAQDNEETALGLFCVASPIQADGDRTVAAISISVPSSRVTPQRLEELGKAVRSAANEMSIALGEVLPSTK